LSIVRREISLRCWSHRHCRQALEEGKYKIVFRACYFLGQMVSRGSATSILGEPEMSCFIWQSDIGFHMRRAQRNIFVVALGCRECCWPILSCSGLRLPAVHRCTVGQQEQAAEILYLLPVAVACTPRASPLIPGLLPTSIEANVKFDAARSPMPERPVINMVLLSVLVCQLNVACGRANRDHRIGFKAVSGSLRIHI